MSKKSAKSHRAAPVVERESTPEQEAQTETDYQAYGNIGLGAEQELLRSAKKSQHKKKRHSSAAPAPDAKKSKSRARSRSRKEKPTLSSSNAKKPNLGCQKENCGCHEETYSQSEETYSEESYSTYSSSESESTQSEPCHRRRHRRRSCGPKRNCGCVNPECCGTLCTCLLLGCATSSLLFPMF